MIPSASNIAFVTGTITGAIVGIALASIAIFSWNTLIDNPRVIAKAREEYVAKSELVSLQAKIQTEESRRKIAEAISDKYAKNLDEAIQKNKVDQASQEVEIAEYEARLKAAGRSCTLDRSDIEWMWKP